LLWDSPASSSSDIQRGPSEFHRTTSGFQDLANQYYWFKRINDWRAYWNHEFTCPFPYLWSSVVICLLMSLDLSQHLERLIKILRSDSVKRVWWVSNEDRTAPKKTS
jgi:hypothetical protein